MAKNFINHKVTISERVTLEFITSELETGINLDDLGVRIHQLKDKYGESAVLTLEVSGGCDCRGDEETYCWCDDPSAYLAVDFDRDETDEEFARRLSKHNAQLKRKATLLAKAQALTGQSESAVN